MFQIFRNVELEITEADSQVINRMRRKGMPIADAHKLYHFNKMKYQRVTENLVLLIGLKSRRDGNV